MMRMGILALALATLSAPVLAAPVSLVFDHDIAVRASYRSLGSVLLPIGRGLAADYAVGFAYTPGSAPGQGGGIFNDGGALTVMPTIPAGSAIGFRLIAATVGDAEHAVQGLPVAETLRGSVDPLAISLLLPAVQTVREPPSGDGPTCEPPPEPVCEPPANGAAPFEPVDWLVIDFAEALLSFEVRGAHAFRPAEPGFGPHDMAVEVHYLRRVEVDAPSTLALLAVGVLALGSRRCGEAKKAPRGAPSSYAG